MDSDIFSDLNLMNQNINSIAHGATAMRVSSDHYLWLATWRSLVQSVVHLAGGEVEGHPTSSINILQRIRELVRIEGHYHELHGEDLH